MKLSRLLIIFFLCSIFAFAGNIDYDHEISVKDATFRRIHDKPNRNSITTLWDRPEPGVLPETYISPLGKFIIYYTKTGINKVDLTDNNHNNIPDYIDSVAYYFDFAYQKEVLEMGYLEPLEDSTVAGKEFEIFVGDCGNGDSGETFYGMTAQTTKYPKTSAGFDRYAAFIIIDNDFSKNDKTKLADSSYLQTYPTLGFDALKITAVHEYHHAIQFAYGDPTVATISINEMTSTFMEYRFFPEVLDYQRYINKLFKDLSKYPFGNGYYNNGYPWSAFMIMIHSKYGDKVIKNLWINIGAGMQGFQALNEALRSENSNIITELKDVTNWLYYTGSRAIEGKYFSNAATWKELTFFQSTNYSSPAYITSNNLEPFQLRPFRLVFKSDDISITADTLDFILINNDLDNAFYQFIITKNYNISVSEDLANCNQAVLDSKYCFTNQDETGQIIPIIYQHLGTNVVNGDFVFPSPFNPAEDNFIAFPIDYKTVYGSKFNLSIYDLNNTLIYSDLLPISFQQVGTTSLSSRKVVKWTAIPGNISSGVYLYHLDGENCSKIGKFTVKR